MLLGGGVVSRQWIVDVVFVVHHQIDDDITQLIGGVIQSYSIDLCRTLLK